MDEQQPIEQPIAPQEPVQVSPSVPEPLTTFPGPPSMPVAATSGISAKTIAMIIGLLVLAGGVGAYFVFSSKTSTSTSADQASNNTAQQNNYGSMVGSFQCKDLLPDDKFREISGYSDFQTAGEGRDRTVNGLNMIPGHPGAGDQAVSAGIQQIVCSYAFTTKGKELLQIAGVGGDLSYTVVWGGDASNGVAFNNGRKLYSQTITGEFNGETITITPDPEVSIDVLGVGAMAYFKGGLLQVLSSNKNYNIGFVGGNDLNNSREIQKNLAKIIDSNLNKY